MEPRAQRAKLRAGENSQYSNPCHRRASGALGTEAVGPAWAVGLWAMGIAESLWMSDLYMVFTEVVPAPSLRHYRVLGV